MCQKIEIKIMALLGVFVLLNGCGKSEVAGEMFIVTAARENIEMGGARVYFVSDVDSSKYFKQEKNNRDKEVEVKKNELENELLKNKELFTSSSEDGLLITQKIVTVINSIYEAALTDPEFIDRSAFFPGYDFSSGKAFVIAEIRTRPTTKTRQYVDELLELEKSVFNVSKISNAYWADYEKFQIRYSKETAGFGFEDVLKSVEKLSKIKEASLHVYAADTNAQGKFFISIPVGKYRILSYQERRLPSGLVEKYYWSVSSDFKGKKNFRLDNSNLSVSTEAALAETIK